jgi:hypothetical protein
MRVSWGESHNRIRHAICRKAKKYGQPELPLIVGISVVDPVHVDMIDIMRTLSSGMKGSNAFATLAVNGASATYGLAMAHGLDRRGLEILG